MFQASTNPSAWVCRAPPVSVGGSLLASTLFVALRVGQAPDKPGQACTPIPDGLLIVGPLVLRQAQDGAIGTVRGSTADLGAFGASSARGCYGRQELNDRQSPAMTSKVHKERDSSVVLPQKGSFRMTHAQWIPVNQVPDMSGLSPGLRGRWWQ